MKKIFLAIVLTFILFFGSQSADAKNIKVVSLMNFSTQNPSPVYTVKTLEHLAIDNQVFPPETIISGRIIRIEIPQRGKRNGYFEFIPETLSYDGKIQVIENPEIIIKILGYKPLDTKKIVFTVVKGTANHFVKGFGLCADFVTGVAQAENGERIKSGMHKVYKESFLSYIEFGNEINVNEGDMLTLQVKKIR